MPALPPRHSLPQHPPNICVSRCVYLFMRIIAVVCLLGPAVLLSSCGRDDELTTTSPAALAHYRTGLDHFEKFHYTEAIAEFEKAIEGDSSFAMAWARLALVYGQSGHEAQAQAKIARAMAHAPVASLREQLYIRMWDHRLNYRSTAAALVADSLRARFPNEPEAYTFRGQLYEMNKNLDSAILMYQQAVSVDSTYPPAVMLLGYAYSSADLQDQALRQMERYIRLAPHAADPRASYADLLLRVGRYSEALEQYRTSLELKPDYWYSINRIGSIYLVLGKLNDAKEQFEKGTRLLPGEERLEASLRLIEAGIEMQRGRYEAALSQYLSVSDEDSTMWDASYGVVNALISLKRYGQAEERMARIRKELARRELTGSTAMLGLYLAQAKLMMESGNAVAAHAACDSALEFTTPLTRAAVMRMQAEVFLRERRFDEAFEACEGALHPNPNSPQALLTLTRIYHAKGDRRMTREVGGRLLEMWKNADADFQDLIEVQRLTGTRART